MPTDCPQRQAQICLSSGQLLTIDRIQLYPEPEYTKYLRLTDQAVSVLGGRPTAMGVLGSPAWALAGAALLTIADSVQSNAKATEGAALLREAAVLKTALLASGRYFLIHEIAGSEFPLLRHWSASAEAEFKIDLQRLSISERAAELKKYKLTGDNISQGKAWVRSVVPFVPIDEEFVVVESAGTQISVRWASLTSYRLV